MQAELQHQEQQLTLLQQQLGEARAREHALTGPQILKSLYIVALWSKFTRALTFENPCIQNVANFYIVSTNALIFGNFSKTNISTRWAATARSRRCKRPGLKAEYVITRLN